MRRSPSGQGLVSMGATARSSDPAAEKAHSMERMPLRAWRSRNVLGSCGRSRMTSRGAAATAARRNSAPSC